MLPDVKITSFPAAGSLTGDELLVAVQSGRSVKVEISQLAGVGFPTQTLFTLNQETSLPASRQLTFADPIFATDNGAQGTYNVRLSAPLTNLSNVSTDGYMYKSGDNFSTVSSAVGGLPLAGATDYYLGKNSPTDGDVAWLSPYNIFNNQNVFFPEQYGAKADAFGAHDGVWDGTWFSSASYNFTAADVGVTFWEDSNARIITAVGTGADAGKMQTSPAPYGTTGILWVKGTDDAPAIQLALDAASNIMKRGSTEDALGINSYVPSGGVVVLTPGKAYGVFNSSASFSGGKTACLTVHRRTSLVGGGFNVSAIRSALICLPGTYGDVIGNLSDTSYTDYVTVGNIMIYGYTDFQSSNARNGIRWVVPTGNFDKTDAFNRFFNVIVDRCRLNGYYFQGRGGLVVDKCDGNYNQNYGIYLFGQYDYKVLGCDFGGNKKSGVRIYSSGSATISDCKSFYNGASGAADEKDCANWVLDGDQMRAGFVFLSNCEGQESRGSSWWIGTGCNIMTNCKGFDPARNGINSGTLPTIIAGLRLYGEGCRQNTFRGFIVGPSVAVYSTPNWPTVGNANGVYIDGLVSSSGPQLNQGDIWTYRATINTGGGTQVGTQYSGTGAAKAGGGISNGQNLNLTIDGVACT